MTKIYGKNFVLTECHIDSQGDRIWNVSPIDSFSFPEFLIHAFRYLNVQLSLALRR